MCFVTGFAQKSKHILFVALNTRLVKGIDSENISAERTCLFEEVDKLAEVMFVHIVKLYDDVRHVAVRMGENRALKSLLVYKRYALACEEVKTVNVVFIVFDIDLVNRVFKGDNRFKQRSFALLNILTHRVKVC